MKYVKKLRGARVYLSPMCAQDAQQYYEWLNDPAVTDGVGTTANVMSLEGEQRWLAENAGDYQFAIVLETTTAADIAGVEEINQVCRLGKGPVISVMDRGAIYDKGLVNLAIATAQSRGIPAQIKEGVYGGNDARSVHTARAGVRTLAISMPCRYLHSPSCVLKTQDITATRDLTAALLASIWEESAR